MCIFQNPTKVIRTVDTYEEGVTVILTEKKTFFFPNGYGASLIRSVNVIDGQWVEPIDNEQQWQCMPLEEEKQASHLKSEFYVYQDRELLEEYNDVFEESEIEEVLDTIKSLPHKKNKIESK